MSDTFSCHFSSYFFDKTIHHSRWVLCASSFRGEDQIATREGQFGIGSTGVRCSNGSFESSSSCAEVYILLAQDVMMLDVFQASCKTVLLILLWKINCPMMDVTECLISEVIICKLIAEINMLHSCFLHIGNCIVLV